MASDVIHTSKSELFRGGEHTDKILVEKSAGKDRRKKKNKEKDQMIF